MKARLFLRVAKRPHWHGNSNYKVDASAARKDAPLTVGDKTLRTLHFAVDIEIPDEAFAEPAMPVIGVRLDETGGFALEPLVEQVDLEPPALVTALDGSFPQDGAA